jgi:hypothetical protein
VPDHIAVGPPATELLKIMLEVKTGGLGDETAD